MKIKRIVSFALIVVMLFAFTACKKQPEPPKFEGTLYASFDRVFEDGSAKVSYVKKTEALEYEFGFDSNLAADFAASSDSWSVYSLNLKISNNTAVSQTFFEFSSSALPDGMWLSKISRNGTVTVDTNITDVDFPATVIIDTRKVNVADMYKALGNIAIEIKYFATPADGNDEAPESEHKKLAVTNNLVIPDTNIEPEKQLSAKRTNIEDGSAFLETYRSNVAAFKSEAELFGIDEATAEKILAANSGWEWYTLNIEIENKTADDLTVFNIVAADNGKNGVWISSLSQYGEYGMPANNKSVLPVSVLVDTSAIGDKSAQEAIAALNIQLEYVAGELVDDEGNENVLPSKFINVK